MPTVDKETADNVIAGAYPESKYTRIIKYTNYWGGESYGLDDSPDKSGYQPSEYIINPIVYWENK